jgi:hypothetical protein
LRIRKHAFTCSFCLLDASRGHTQLLRKDRDEALVLATSKPDIGHQRI